MIDKWMLGHVDMCRVDHLGMCKLPRSSSLKKKKKTHLSSAYCGSSSRGGLMSPSSLHDGILTAAMPRFDISWGKSSLYLIQHIV